MFLNIGQRTLCLQILQKIVFSKSADEYELNYEELKQTKINSVMEYFNKNWHPIKNEWVVYFQSKFMTLGCKFKYNMLY